MSSKLPVCKRKVNAGKAAVTRTSRAPAMGNRAQPPREDAHSPPRSRRYFRATLDLGHAHTPPETPAAALPGELRPCSSPLAWKSPSRAANTAAPTGRISPARPPAPTAAALPQRPEAVTNTAAPRTCSAPPARAAGRAPARSRSPPQPPEAGRACGREATQLPPQRPPPP